MGNTNWEQRLQQHGASSRQGWDGGQRRRHGGHGGPRHGCRAS
ncbi:hypothetical protein [Nocardioides sp. B-3]|nr:hypothetical protein [Nocardioides sp. B-3]